MKKDDIILTTFFSIVLLIFAKSASLTYNPRLMGLLGLLFFVTLLALALRK